jgi:hypothetical protein
VDAVAKGLTSCTFDLASLPATLDVHVFFNDDPAEIMEDGINGYTIDMNSYSIAFHGMACDFIKSGNVVDLDVVEGCAEPTPD